MRKIVRDRAKNVNPEQITNRSRPKQKKAALFPERPLAKSSGEEGKTLPDDCSPELTADYIEGGGVAPAVEPPVAPWPSIVFVISLMLTRRLAARPSRVLFSSTGLSFPRPIK